LASKVSLELRKCHVDVSNAWIVLLRIAGLRLSWIGNGQGHCSLDVVSVKEIACD